MNIPTKLTAPCVYSIIYSKWDQNLEKAMPDVSSDPWLHNMCVLGQNRPYCLYKKINIVKQKVALWLEKDSMLLPYYV